MGPKDKKKPVYDEDEDWLDDKWDDEYKEDDYDEDSYPDYDDDEDYNQ